MALGCAVNSAVQDEFQEIKTGPESINQRWTTPSILLQKQSLLLFPAHVGVRVFLKDLVFLFGPP